MAAVAINQLSFPIEREERPRLRVVEPEPDALEWLLHAAGCTACTLARAALSELFREGWDPDRLVPVACPTGVRMMELEDIELMLGPDGGLDREWEKLWLAALREHADARHGSRYAGMAWNFGR